MGNGSSQSIVLGPPRYQQTPFQSTQRPHALPKYAHPQNRVLPLPVAGQRLRTTDNGSILQAAGTIRGQRAPYKGQRPYAEDYPRRQSEMMEEEEYHNFQPNLRNHRMFHSDPNISRRPEDDPAMGGYNNNRRSYGGGAAVRASNMKYKKKSRAPDPPPSTGSSLPRHMETRRQQSKHQDDIRNRKNMAACKCIVSVSKTRAPQPPSIVVQPPPPPPPLPKETVTTRTSPQTSKSRAESSSRSPSVTRAVECNSRTSCYEKNVHPLEKWRNCRSAGDIRIDEGEDEGPLNNSRTTVFDSRKISEGGPGSSRIPSYLPQKPDPFQKEIQAVTKKIAQSRQQTNSPEDKPDVRNEMVIPKTGIQRKETSSPPKFYFADPSVFKAGNVPQKTDPMHSDRTIEEGVLKADSTRSRSQEEQQTSTCVDEVVPSLQRFSPGRRRVKSPSTPTPQQKAEREWEQLSKSLYHLKQDPDIDVRLRPVLPRKLPEVSKFSPSEAWQALGSDGQGSSNHSTSDDGRLSPYKQRNLMQDRPRRFSDIDYERNKRNEAFQQHRSLSDSHWTPRQDLIDDSDVSSEDASDEEAVVPRMRPGLGEISTRFSLPTVMFSNMRPIGTEIKSNSATQPYVNDSNAKMKQAKKKIAKRSDDRQAYDGGNFKMRFLSKRNNKYQSEEDIAVSDSNWTFGQNGLQKRGKQYSSELLLSDKKKYELMKDNFGDFLGDILMSKSNHMRNQMKSSDSGNSNFSFYSTEGQVMYMPDKGRFVTEEVEVECSPPTKGRVYDMRRRFDANLGTKSANLGVTKSAKKKAAEIEVGRKRDLELAKMLEDEVRRRRNKEKIGIRQQLQRMKHRLQEDEDDFDDEAYFTEPKSREEESQSPPFFTSQLDFVAGSDLGLKPSRFFGQGSSVTAVDSSRLSHWQSSPALLEDSLLKNGMQPTPKGRLSLSSAISSPESEAVWAMQQSGVSGVVDSWLRRQQQLQLDKKSTAIDRVTAGDDGDVSSSSPSPAAGPLPKKERRGKTNIYKQLMDIVRKEERHLNNAQRGCDGPDSRGSSYSHRESSPSTSSESSSSSTYSDSTSGGARNGVPANQEFGYRQHPSSFQVAFVQPYSASKTYRPVPFDVVASSGCRLPGLQEEGKHVRAEVS